MLLPGSGFCTATENVPAVERLPTAVSCVLDRKVVVRDEPFKTTCAPETKALPVMVRVKLPRFVAAGEMPVSTGVGFRRVTALVAYFEESAVLAAAMVTVLGDGSVAGAV